ncbi:hypothetical protein QOT17_020520 [Balamuthia mandrillaris]
MFPSPVTIPLPVSYQQQGRHPHPTQQHSQMHQQHHTPSQHLEPVGSDKEKKFEELVSRFREGMLISERNGQLRARPMYVCKVDEHEDLWFATGLHSEKVQELEKNPHVCVTFQDNGHFISISGTASVVSSEAAKRELWSVHLKPYFPEGPEDKELSFVKVRSQWGEYWDTSGVGRTIKSVMSAGKAVMSGEKVNPEDMGDSAKVELSK